MQTVPVKKGIPAARVWVLSGIVATASLVLYLSVSLQSERHLREELQAQLADKNAELSEKTATLVDLEQQKADLSQQLNTKISDLESTLNDAEGKRKELIDEIRALQNDLEDRENQIEEWTKKYASTERENLKLIQENQAMKESAKTPFQAASER